MDHVLRLGLKYSETRNKFGEATCTSPLQCRETCASDISNWCDVCRGYYCTNIASELVAFVSALKSGVVGYTRFVMNDVDQKLITYLVREILHTSPFQRLRNHASDRRNMLGVVQSIFRNDLAKASVFLFQLGTRAHTRNADGKYLSALKQWRSGG